MDVYMGGPMSMNTEKVSYFLPITNVVLSVLTAITFTKAYGLFTSPEPNIPAIQTDKLINVSTIETIHIPVPTPYEVEKIIYIDKLVEVPVDRIVYQDKVVEIPVEKIVYVDRVLVQTHDDYHPFF